MSEKIQYTPMLQQFLEIKSQYAHTLLLYRMGDFYETFFDDARTASQELEITLTSRDGGEGKRVPMAGIPHHALEAYLPKLIDKGYKVAICEQMEPPKAGKLVKREVVRVLTPGTLLEGGLLNEKRNNFLGAVYRNKAGFGLAYADISTGEFQVTQIIGTNAQDILNREMACLGLVEVLLPSPEPWLEPNVDETEWRGLFPEQTLITWESEIAFEPTMARDRLHKHFKVVSLEGFGCHDKPMAIAAAGAILHYLANTQMSALEQLHAIKTYQVSDYMMLDRSTQRNLELMETWRDRTFDGSLLWVLDHTRTAMGGRLMRQWLGHPLMNLQVIKQRLDAVETLFQDDNLRFDLQESLGEVRDMERLSARVAAQSANARDLKALAQSILTLPRLSQLLQDTETELLCYLHDIPKTILQLAEKINQQLVDTPPIGLKEGGIFAHGISDELDELQQLLKGGKSWIQELEREEKERTGIRSLKVGFSRTFGYFIEISHANRELVPEDYHRKQTLVNAERYITPALKEKEAAILNAEEHIKELEYQLFVELRNEVSQYVPQLQTLARAVATMDVVTALAEVAVRNQYTRPILNQGDSLEIYGGRHPIIEKHLPNGQFVPNDTWLDTTTQQLIILTGPNMSGKSSYMRQTGLIVLMAQMGSFVPATQARVGICDRIFTRVGAVDDMATGQSTFMVEMNETANIMHNATRKSLILLDEIGRGTSTFDGVSIAWAVSEHIAKEIGARTIFATHYHELNKLAEQIPAIQNYQVTVQESGNRIVFLHKVIPGGTDRSYGIEVARLAGLPHSLLERAKDVLSDIERRSRIQSGLLKKNNKKDEDLSVIQLSLFE